MPGEQRGRAAAGLGPRPAVRTLTGAGVLLAGPGLPGFAFTRLPVHLGAGRVAEPDPRDHTLTAGHRTRRPGRPVAPAAILFD